MTLQQQAFQKIEQLPDENIRVLIELMDVLVDTNVFIDYWKHPTEELEEKFNKIVTCKYTAG